MPNSLVWWSGVRPVRVAGLDSIVGIVGRRGSYGVGKTGGNSHSGAGCARDRNCGRVLADDRTQAVEGLPGAGNRPEGRPRGPGS